VVAAAARLVQRRGMTSTARTSLIAHLAALVPFVTRQFGVFTVAQAASVGVSRQRLHDLARAGLLIRRYRGVYAVATSPDSWDQRAMAGLLAAGPDACVSGLAAAKLHGLSHLGVTSSQPALEWTIPRTGRRSTDGPSVVTEQHLTDADVVARGAWRLTSAAWTIFTQAHRLGVDRTERALDAAVAAGDVRSSQAGETATRFRRCVGMPVIREVLLRHDPAVRLTRSEAERILLRALRRAGLPAPQVNVRVVDAYGQRRYLDFAYVAWKVMIEVDVHSSHTRTVGRHHDGHRQNGLVPPWVPLRFDELDLVYELDRVVADVRRTLVAVGAIPASR
jgi:very-short-patch-repair endonuclease